MSTIERLKELEAKATPGPWDSHDGAWNGSSVSTLNRNKYVIFTVEKYSDAELIAEMRNSISKILALVEAFKAMDLRCDDEDLLLDEPSCGDCKVCRANVLMAEL